MTQDEEGGSLAGTSTDGVLGPVEMDGDAAGGGRNPGGNGAGNSGDGGAVNPAAGIGGRRITFADGLTEAGGVEDSSSGGSAAQGADSGEGPTAVGRSSWDGFRP